MLGRKSSTCKATEVPLSHLENLECLEQPDKWSKLCLNKADWEGGQV